MFKFKKETTFSDKKGIILPNYGKVYKPLPPPGLLPLINQANVRLLSNIFLLSPINLFLSSLIIFVLGFQVVLNVLYVL
jgi:hypothetical protein